MNGLERTKELLSIRQSLMDEGSSLSEANLRIATELSVVVPTVQTWCSINRLGFPTQPIPQRNLDLLRFKLGKD